MAKTSEHSVFHPRNFSTPRGVNDAPALAQADLYAWGVLLTPALGAVLMAASTVIVAISTRLLRWKKGQGAGKREQELPANTKERENRDQKAMAISTEKET